MSNKVSRQCSRELHDWPAQSGQGSRANISPATGRMPHAEGRQLSWVGGTVVGTGRHLQASRGVLGLAAGARQTSGWRGAGDGDGMG